MRAFYKVEGFSPHAPKYGEGFSPQETFEGFSPEGFSPESSFCEVFFPGFEYTMQKGKNSIFATFGGYLGFFYQTVICYRKRAKNMVKT